MEFSAPTILYQAVLFVVLYFGLKQLVFEPFLASLEARHRRTRGALEEAAKLREETSRLQGEYEQQMAAIRREAAAAADEIRRQAEKEEHQIIDAARQEAARSIAQARQAVAAQTQTTRAALAAETDRLSAEILASVLGQHARIGGGPSLSPRWHWRHARRSRPSPTPNMPRTRPPRSAASFFRC